MKKKFSYRARLHKDGKEIREQICDSYSEAATLKETWPKQYGSQYYVTINSFEKEPSLGGLLIGHKWKICAIAAAIGISVFWLQQRGQQEQERMFHAEELLANEGLTWQEVSLWERGGYTLEDKIYLPLNQAQAHELASDIKSYRNKAQLEKEYQQWLRTGRF
jgi:hypothetical protein